MLERNYRGGVEGLNNNTSSQLTCTNATELLMYDHYTGTISSKNNVKIKYRL